MNIHALISRSEGKEETETGEKSRARTKKHEYGDARRSVRIFTSVGRESVLHNRSVFSFVNAACADAKLPGQ